MKNKVTNICAFGDSLVYGMGDEKIDGGWVTRLQHKVKGKNKFCNFGIPGDTSEDLLKRINRELIEKTPDVSFVFIGTNDSQYDDIKSETLISTKEYKKNLKKISEEIEKYSSKIIFVGLIKMNDEITTNWKYKYHFCNANLKKYDTALKNFCDKNNYTYIALFDLLNDDDLSDGAHPNSQGYEKIANRIFEAIDFKSILR